MELEIRMFLLFKLFKISFREPDSVSHLFYQLFLLVIFSRAMSDAQCNSFSSRAKSFSFFHFSHSGPIIFLCLTEVLKVLLYDYLFPRLIYKCISPLLRESSWVIIIRCNFTYFKKLNQKLIVVWLRQIGYL